MLLETAHTNHGEDMGDTDEDDADADEGWKRDSGDIKILEAKEAKDGTGNAQQQKRPPVREAHFLVVETQDSDANAFDNNP